MRPNPTEPLRHTTSSRPDAPRLAPQLSRRTLLLGAGSVAVLGACSSNTATSTGSGSTGTTATAGGGTLALVPRFDQNEYAVAGVEQRLVVSLLEKGAAPTNAPSSIDVTIANDGAPIGPAMKVAAHTEGVPTPYYPVVFTPAAPGTYSLRSSVPGTDPITFVVAATSALVQPGQPMKPSDTPTRSDPRGVDPICTRPKGQCALHDLNLRDALTTGKPTALLVSTPQFCQIGVCGPVLENLLAMRDAYPGIQFIHAEVYKRPNADPSNPSAGGIAPIVDALGLNFEPSLFVVGADGTVRARLDNVFDIPETKAALDRASGATTTGTAPA